MVFGLLVEQGREQFLRAADIQLWQQKFKPVGLVEEKKGLL